MLFNNLQLIEPVLRALVHEGYTKPTLIQEKGIPVILQKRDLLACAQTGTGKTATFAIPILQLMHQQKEEEFRDKNSVSRIGNSSVQTLILTPTRELAIQIEESFKAYGRYLNLKRLAIFGGVSQFNQVKALRGGIDILIATPGRLLDLMAQRHLSLHDIKYFVLDEADRMLDMGFVNDVKKIITKLPAKKQTLFFSATMPPEIRQLSNMLLVNPVTVEVTPVSSTVETAQQLLYYVEKQNKRSLLIHLLAEESIGTALVFTKTKHGADRIARDLFRAGIKAEAIHGNKSQNERQRALNNFKARRTRVLVATDIAARGIDIDELGHVINYDLPNIPETYVHRIGRTARAGASGTAISFCDYEEKIYLVDIQKLIGKKISIVKDHPYDVAMMHPQVQANSQQTSSFSKRRNPGAGKRYGRTFRQRA
ncbi:MAG TPA: DEAD/DEAH box helicase [Chitinophagaceae bacterium]|nr:DEAD/DEAH box helicase [Chitinophagaceae bacterium]